MTEPPPLERPNSAKTTIAAAARLTSKGVLFLCAIGAFAQIFATASPAYSFFRDFCDLSPLLLAFGLCGLAIAALSRRPFWHAAIPGALVVASGWSVTPEMLRLAHEMALKPATVAAQPVRVLTANLWSYNYSFDKFLNLVRVEDPDILIVQEANGFWWVMLGSLAPKYKFVSGCTAPSQCNVAILSKFDAAPDTSVWTSAIASVDLILPERQGGGQLSVIGVHVSRSPRRQQEKDIAAAARLASTRQPRLILAGDFNATPWSGRLRPLDALPLIHRRTIGAPTWPTPSRRFTPLHLRSRFALFPIDHVYAGNEFATESTRRLADFGSDHYPVLTTLVLKEKAASTR